MTQPLLQPPAELSESLAVAQMPRFCGHCGRPLTPAGSPCIDCSTPPPLLAAATGDADARAIKSALALYFSMLGISIITLFASLQDADEWSLELVGTIAMSAIVALWCVLRRDTLSGLLRARAAALWYAIAAVVPLGTFLLASGCIALLVHLIDIPVIYYLDTYGQGTQAFLLAILLVCVQPAIFEELAFRGIIHKSLRVVLSPWPAILVGAGMFAILHLSIMSLPHLLVLGIVLGWLRWRSGSLYPCMLLHFLHNLLVIAAEEWEGVLPW